MVTFDAKLIPIVLNNAADLFRGPLTDDDAGNDGWAQNAMALAAMRLHKMITDATYSDEAERGKAYCDVYTAYQALDEKYTKVKFTALTLPAFLRCAEARDLIGTQPPAEAKPAAAEVAPAAEAQPAAEAAPAEKPAEDTKPAAEAAPDEEKKPAAEATPADAELPAATGDTPGDALPLQEWLEGEEGEVAIPPADAEEPGAGPRGEDLIIEPPMICNPQPAAVAEPPADEPAGEAGTVEEPPIAPDVEEAPAETGAAEDTAPAEDGVGEFVPDSIGFISSFADASNTVYFVPQGYQLVWKGFDEARKILEADAFIRAFESETPAMRMAAFILYTFAVSNGLPQAEAAKGIAALEAAAARPENLEMRPYIEDAYVAAQALSVRSTVLGSLPKPPAEAEAKKEDYDGDGIDDLHDRCPKEAGSSENQGCPAEAEETKAK